ncbi:MAG: lactam utilization protein LamB [Acidobacteria bacterium]|nr:lactam utilization protein LamB [Acidobacteriota bacterium]
MQRIDLNGDVGESFGAYTIGHDTALLRHVTSANVACGLHGGDPSVMRQTVRLAVAGGVALGAHPGFPDLQGFGRREITLSAQEVEDLVAYQIGALAGVAAAEEARLHHVKPHGALYNMAARDRGVADAVARAVVAVDATLVLYGLSGSCLVEAGEAVGLRPAAEGFADRAYETDGSLVSRDQPGAVIDNPKTLVERAVRLVQEGSVTARGGDVVALRRDTICLHGDTPGAGQLAAQLRSGLEAAGIRVLPIGIGD